MTERPCSRCHTPVPREDGQLFFCGHCGLPQIFLAEDMQAELAEGARAFHEREAAQAELPLAPDTDTSSSRRRGPLARFRSGHRGADLRPWPLGVRVALLSAAGVLVLGLCSLLLPPVGIFMVLWGILAPVLAVFLFYARNSARPAPEPGFAARLGLLTGILIVCCGAAVLSLSLVLTRFVFHDAAALDAQLAAMFAQQRTVLLARLGADAQPTLALLATPEYRVGLLLSVIGTSGAIYLLLSSLAAALADAVLRRRHSLPG